MSRSFKHTPRCGDKKDKFYKNYANRRLRRKQLIHNLQHKTYKKDTCSYDICDYEEVGLIFEECKYINDYNLYAKWFLRK